MGKKDKAVEGVLQTADASYAESATASASNSNAANALIAQEMKKVHNRKRNVIMAVVIAVVAIACATAAIVFFVLGGGSADSAAQEGQAPYKSEEEMQAESEREIAEGMFNISIATRIEFENANSEGLAYIENVPNNPYDMRVVITEDETGDVLYESGVITPNHYIEKIRLNKTLDAGEHAATATFTALDKETQEEAGQAAGAVTLIIGE